MLSYAIIFQAVPSNLTDIREISMSSFYSKTKSSGDISQNVILFLFSLFLLVMFVLLVLLGQPAEQHWPYERYQHPMQKP